MLDGEIGHRPASILTGVLEETMRCSDAPLGILVEFQGESQIKVWAHRTVTYYDTGTNNPLVSGSAQFEPHTLSDSDVSVLLSQVRHLTRPKMITLSDLLPPPFLALYQINSREQTIKTMLVIPASRGDFMIVLFAPIPWVIPTLEQITGTLDTAVFEFCRLRQSHRSESIARLVLGLSAVDVSGVDYSVALANLCNFVRTQLGFGTGAAFALEGDRLVLAQVRLPEHSTEAPLQLQESFISDVYTSAAESFRTRKPVLILSKDLSQLPEKLVQSLCISGDTIVLPMIQSGQPIGLILLANPSKPGGFSLIDGDEAQVLLVHLSLLFSQILEEHAKLLRAQAWDGVQTMLDAATQIESREQMAAFLAKSLATSLGVGIGVFFLFDAQHNLASMQTYGLSDRHIDHPAQLAICTTLLAFLDQHNLVNTHRPTFFEPHQEIGYSDSLSILVGKDPYLLAPIATSEGLAGVALAVVRNQNPFWNLQQRSIASDWLVSATLVADNIGLRLAERQNLASYRDKAFKDSLTGLPNRELFYDRLQVATAKAQRTQQLTSLIFIDIDVFKLVNDLNGHLAGDELLIQIAKRLTTAFRDTDTVARLAGDEFVVLVESSPDKNEIVEIARRAFDRLNDTYTIGTAQLDVTISMGLAIGEPGIDGTDLLERADQAMYHSKQAGRARLSVYSDLDRYSQPTLDLAAIERRQSTGELGCDPTQRKKVNPFRFDDTYIRFNADYVDFAKLKNLTTNFQTGSEGLEFSKRRLDGFESRFLRGEYGTLKLEIMRPSLVGDSIGTTPNSPLELLKRLGGASSEFIIDAATSPFKVLVRLDGLTGFDIGNLNKLVGNYQGSFAQTHPLVLSISVHQLNAEPAILNAISAAALTHHAEIMITSVEDRTVRLYDLLMPMVTYLCVNADDALADSRRDVPNNLSTMAAIARDRGIRLCASGVSDTGIIDTLVLSGITILSGPAIESAVGTILRNQSLPKLST